MTEPENQKPVPESGGSPQKGAILLVNNPPHSRDLCRSEPPDVEGEWFFVGFPVAGAQKGKCAAPVRTVVQERVECPGRQAKAERKTQR